MVSLKATARDRQPGPECGDGDEYESDPHHTAMKTRTKILYGVSKSADTLRKTYYDLTRLHGAVWSLWSTSKLTLFEVKRQPQSVIHC